jgi:hypothetical protein
MLVRSHARQVVSRSMNRLMSLESEAALDDLFRIGDGPDRALAAEAIGSLSSYAANPRIVQYLRRKMTDGDRGLALNAAITSCYSGDASGGALVVRCLKSDDPALRLTAIARRREPLPPPPRDDRPRDAGRIEGPHERCAPGACHRVAGVVPLRCSEGGRHAVP